ncbi:MAG: hypothetical protein ACI8RZ_002254, partial [Myxococcota bacterium]
EVGPLICVGGASEVTEHTLIPSSPEPIRCREAKVCTRMTALMERYTAEAE